MTEWTHEQMVAELADFIRSNPDVLGEAITHGMFRPPQAGEDT